MKIQHKIWLTVIFAAIAVLFFALFAHAEDKKPTELSQTKLELSQAKLKLSYAAFQNAQNDFQKLMNEFNAQCAIVAKEVGKPAGTRCNPDNLDFIIPKADNLDVTKPNPAGVKK